MEGFGWIMSIIIGALAGWIAEKVMKFDTGLLMNIVLWDRRCHRRQFVAWCVRDEFGGIFRPVDRCHCRRLYPYLRLSSD